MRYRALVVALAAVALGGCGDEPTLSERSADEMHAQVEAVRTAADDGDRAAALEALEGLAGQVRDLEAGGSLAEADAAALGRGSARARRRVRAELSPAPTPTPTPTPTPAAAAPPTEPDGEEGGEEGGESGTGDDEQKGEGETGGKGQGKGQGKAKGHDKGGKGAED